MSPPSPREGFLLSPLRNSTKDTNSILYTRRGTNPRHEAYAQNNYLYIRGKRKAKVQIQKENNGTTLGDHKDHKQHLS